MSNRRLRIRLAFWGGITGFLFAAWAVVTEPVLFAWHNRASPSVPIARLDSHVRRLSEDFVPRDSEHIENLDKAAAYIKGEFLKAGARVTEQIYTARRKVYRNVIGSFGPDSGPITVVGAHYDSYGQLPAADDNASGVAGLIELAYLLGQNPPATTVECVAFTLEEPPYFLTNQMGSAVHAESLKKDGAHVRVMISLEMIGYFSDVADSQLPSSLLFRAFYPSRGNFIAIVGRLPDFWVVRRAKRAMISASSLPVKSINAPLIVPGIDLSDQRNYWDQGYRAMMITDTAFLRNDNYHTAQDTADRLDFKRMAMVVQGVYEATVDLAK